MKKLLIFSLLFFTPSAYAQEVDWPATSGSGQPEFDFSRQDLGSEAQSDKPLAARGQVKVRSSGTDSMSSLIRRDLVDPFNEEEQQESIPLLQQLPDTIDIPELPTAEIQEKLNLDEFKNYLNTIVNTAPAQATPDLTNYNFEKDLNKIVISSLMVKPRPYVVINNQRFSIGDRFLMPISLSLDEDRIVQLIDAQMPDPESVSQEAYAEFEALREEAIANYRKKNADGQGVFNANTHNVSVTITGIEHRKVRLSVEGEEFVLPIRMAL